MSLKRLAIPMALALTAVALTAAPSAQADQFQFCRSTSAIAKAPLSIGPIHFAGVSGPSCTTPTISAPVCYDPDPTTLLSRCTISANALASGVGGAGVHYSVEQQLSTGQWIQFEPTFPGAPASGSQGTCAVGGGLADGGQSKSCQAPAYRQIFGVGSRSGYTTTFRAVCTWVNPGFQAYFDTAVQCNLNIAPPILGT